MYLVVKFSADDCGYLSDSTLLQSPGTTISTGQWR